MNVACTQCSARYAINDERIKGRKVRIKCKRCGTALVIDGRADGEPQISQQSSTAGQDTSPTPPGVAADSDRAPASELWLVAISDDDTREMNDAQLVEAYANKTIDHLTYVWREGMADWQTPFEIPVLAGALEAAGHRLSPEALPPRGAGSGAVVWREPGRPSTPENSLPDYEGDDEVTRAVTMEQLEREDAEKTEHAKGLAPLTTGGEFFNRGRAKVSERPSGDLFGRAHTEGSEEHHEPPPAELPPLRTAAEIKQRPEDLESSPHAGNEASAADVDAALTGARHESSVLFSLSALVANEEAKRPAAAAPNDNDRVSDDELLGEAPPPSEPLRHLSMSINPTRPAVPIDDSSDARVSATSLSPMAPVDPSLFTKRAHPGYWWTLAGVLLLAGGVVTLFSLDMMPRITFGPANTTPVEPTLAADTRPASLEPSAQTEPSAQPEPSASTSASAAPSAVPAPEPSATASAPVPELSKPATTAEAKPVPPSEPKPAPPTAPAPAPAPVAATPAPAAPAPAPAPVAAPEPPPAEPAEPALPPFNTEAAKAALGAAENNAKGSCKVPGTPAGTSRVAVTFVPSGKATQALVSGDFAGSEAGSCIARVFRSASIPAFSGSAVTVTKSVTLH